MRVENPTKLRIQRKSDEISYGNPGNILGKYPENLRKIRGLPRTIIGKLGNPRKIMGNLRKSLENLRKSITKIKQNWRREGAEGLKGCRKSIVINCSKG